MYESLKVLAKLIKEIEENEKKGRTGGSDCR